MDSLLSEIGVRLILLVLFYFLDVAEPFHREIHPEELWLYKNPHKPDTFSSFLTVVLGFGVPPIVVAACCLLGGLRSKDFVPSVMATSLSSLITVVLNNAIKLLVGRPRPDFLHRCFPDGVSQPLPTLACGSLRLQCTGDVVSIRDGRKSFPSGHSALACSSFVFISIYLVGQLGLLLPRGRGHAWRICVVIVPSVFALLICLSRYSDYRHHWQDVLAGGALGSTIAWLVYHQYFPSLTHQHCHRPLVALNGGFSATGDTFNGRAGSGPAKPASIV